MGADAGQEGGHVHWSEIWGNSWAVTRANNTYFHFLVWGCLRAHHIVCWGSAVLDLASGREPGQAGPI